VAEDFTFQPSMQAMVDCLEGKFMKHKFTGSNCPFYGCALALYSGNAPFFLPTHGNQCALITSSHAPCYMEVEGQKPEWKLCKVIKDHRIGDK
jgi:hypothetical protein